MKQNVVYVLFLVTLFTDINAAVIRNRSACVDKDGNEIPCIKMVSKMEDFGIKNIDKRQWQWGGRPWTNNHNNNNNYNWWNRNNKIETNFNANANANINTNTNANTNINTNNYENTTPDSAFSNTAVNAAVSSTVPQQMDESTINNNIQQNNQNNQNNQGNLNNWYDYFNKNIPDNLSCFIFWNNPARILA